MNVKLKSGDYTAEPQATKAEVLTKGDIIVPEEEEHRAATVLKVEELNRFEVVVATTFGPKFRTSVLAKTMAVYRRDAVLSVVRLVEDGES